MTPILYFDLVFSFPFSLLVMRGLSDFPFGASAQGLRTMGASLTAVVLIRLVATVVHTVAMKQLRQALGDIPTGEIAEGALDILPTPGNH